MYNHVTYLTNPGGIPHSYIFRRNTFKNRNQHKVSWCIPRYSVGIAQKGLEESETEGWNPVSTEWGKPSAFSTSGTSKGWMQARQRPGVMLKRSITYIHRQATLTPGQSSSSVCRDIHSPWPLVAAALLTVAWITHHLAPSSPSLFPHHR